MKTAKPVADIRGAYSVEGFAGAHGISRAQTYVEIAEGRLKASKCGSRTLVTAENAAAWRAALPAYESTPPVIQGAIAVHKPLPKQRAIKQSREGSS